MKIRISISAELTNSAKITKVMNAMAINPNKGKVAALLYKIPGLKLPSVRPATTMFQRKYQEADPLTLLETFPKANDRKLITDHFSALKIPQDLLQNALPFLNFLSAQLVNSSLYFKSYVQDAHAQRYLLQFLLCGEVTVLDKRLDKLLDALDEDDVVFDPHSLDDVDVEVLKTSSGLNPIDVAARLNKLTKNWFMELTPEEEKQARNTLTKELLADYKQFVSRINLMADQVIIPPSQVAADTKTIKQGLPVDTSSYVALVNGNRYSLNGLLRKLREGVLSAKTPIPTFFSQIAAGKLTDLYNKYPKLASLLVLCTPQLSSAYNDLMRYSKRKRGFTGLSVEVETALWDSGTFDLPLLKEDWMKPYVNTEVMTNSKIPSKADSSLWLQLSDMSVTTLQLYLRKNKVVFTLDDVAHLSIRQFNTILKTVGLEESLTTVFSRVLDEVMFKRKFITSVLETAVARVSPFGGISKLHTRTNLNADNATTTDQGLLSIPAVRSWVPVKQPIKEYLQTIMRSPSSVTEDSEADLAAVEKDLHNYVTGDHGVDFKVLKVWNVKPSTAQLKHLAEAKADGEHYIVKNAFHGTSVSAAGSILLSGFRMSSAFIKTAQAMGAVTYVAPNIDKSLQYIGDNFSRDGEQQGIIFHGDLVLKGKTTVEHKKDLTSANDWVVTEAFKTAEIGLVHPNTQFIVRRAYLVERLRQAPKTINKRSGKFQPLTPVSKYTV